MMEIANLHFLVAEAEPSKRVALVAMLARLGATDVTEVPDGHSALRCFQDTYTRPIDVAVIGLALPGMDGLELIRHLAALRCGARLIVFGAQAASLMFSVETMAQAYGIDLLGTMTEPLSPSLLANLLEHTCSPPPPPPPENSCEGPILTFAEVGLGLKGRQFEPFFQPKIELETGQVKGLEAFARWRHPDYGVLWPFSFIDALEQHKRIDLLDWTMIEQSIARCRAFHDQAIPISISLNVARDTLAHPAFMQQIASCVERHRVMPEYITFELSESSVLTTDPHFLERLLRLRMAGYGLAIDDYGTGRSNLQLLARIPFSELKIDRSFVDGASKKRALGTVLGSCLGLARSLERLSVAVGVETKQDWDFLQGLGCTYAQGFYIATPTDAAAFPGWLEDWHLFF